MSEYDKQFQFFQRFIKRFYDKVDVGLGCWNWMAALDTRGYGIVSFLGKTTKAHRIAWMMANGAIPQGMEICHKCDNQICVNPNHLFIGTHQDNMRDMTNKGRNIPGGVCGEQHPCSKLTIEKVKQMRSLKGKMGYQKIADLFGVGISQAWCIVNGKAWRHVT